MITVLLIEDNALDAFIAQRSIELSGIPVAVQQAADGMGALRYLNDAYQQGRVLPDVILVDINMPRMTGEQFLAAFQALDIPGKEHVRIFFSSSHDPALYRGRLSQLGVADFFQKPITLEVVREALHSIGPGKPD